MIDGFGRTLQGARSDNQDAFCVRPDLGLFAVADGIGGRPGGGEASQIAIESFALELGDRGPQDRASATALAAALQAANGMVVHAGIADPTLAGLGAAFSALVIAGDCNANIVHVGDTRVCSYKPREGGLKRLTCEHTLAYELQLLHRLTDEQTKDYPLRQHLSRYMGTIQPIEPQMIPLQLVPDQWILMFTDGFDKVISLAEAEEILRNANPKNARHVCDELMERALARNPPDNLTIVAVACQGGASTQ